MTLVASIVAAHAAVLALIGMLAARMAACRWLGLKPFLGLTRPDGTPTTLGRRLLVIGSAFPGAYVVCVVPFILAFAIGGTPEPTLEIEVMADLPAAEAGLRSGDVIVSVDDHPLGDWSELPERVAARAAQAVSIVVTRDGATLTFEVTPNEEGRIGVTSVERNRSLPVGEVLGKGFQMPVLVVSRTVATLWNMATRRQQPQLMGPAGIAAEAHRSAREGWSSLLFLAGTLASYSWLWLVVGDGVVLAAYFADRPAPRPAPGERPDPTVFQ